MTASCGAGAARKLNRDRMGFFHFCCFLLFSRFLTSLSAAANVHSVIVGGKGSCATHILIPRPPQWSKRSVCPISALKINSSRGTGGRCTTCSQRRKRRSGCCTATRDPGSSAGKAPPSVLLEEERILLEAQTQHFRDTNWE